MSFTKSHVLPLQELANSLAKRDHSITFVSLFSFNKTPLKTVREIVVKVDEKYFELYDEFAKSMKREEDPNYHDLTAQSSSMMIPFDEIEKLKRTESFDLLIVGWFGAEYLIGLADHFKCPSIIFFAGSAFGPLHEIVGNPLSVDGAPHPMLGSLKEMNFIGRLKNFIVNGIDIFVISKIFNAQARKIYEHNFPPTMYHSYDEMLKNVSLILVNTHFTSSDPRPNLPNMIEVGGLQISDPSPLPKKLKKFLDDSQNGAILFSLGSQAKSIYMPKEKLKIILNVFRKLKQRVIMKWEEDSMNEKPENVYVSKWLPQNDILAHPNMKIFISHCGYGGVVEAKHHGVPIIAFPFAGDQHSNAAKIVGEGWAIRISFNELSEENLAKAIEEMLENSKYSETVKRLSKLSRDRPMSPKDSAVFWVEYVLRNKGAKHLHYPGADLNFLQKNSIDVIGFLVAISFITLKLLKFIFKQIFCRKQGAYERVIEFISLYLSITFYIFLYLSITFIPFKFFCE